MCQKFLEATYSHSSGMAVFLGGEKGRGEGSKRNLPLKTISIIRSTCIRNVTEEVKEVRRLKPVLVF